MSSEGAVDINSALKRYLGNAIQVSSCGSRKSLVLSRGCRSSGVHLLAAGHRLLQVGHLETIEDIRSVFRRD